MVDVQRHEAGTEQRANAVKALHDEGQSVWLDDISRQMIKSGELRRLIEEVGIRGNTSNPTIFEKAIAAGTAYDEDVQRLLREGKGAPDIFEAVAVQDIQAACDLYRPLYEASEGGDGFMSLEVSPTLARDTEGTLRDARRLWAAVDRPNLMVKVPGTAEGVPAVRTLLREGLNINITLLFAISHHEAVMHAYLEALEERHAAGEPVDRIASVASFFVSRVDTLVDKQLDAKIAETDDAAKQERMRGLMGKAAVANAKLAYARFQEIFAGPRWEALRSAGAKVQRPLWASTSTKNPAYRDVLYVEDLIGPDTVNTVPRATLDALLDHAAIRRAIDKDLDAARQTMRDLEAVGIDMEAVTDQLEDEGIVSFAKSFDSLLGGVEGKRSQIAATVAAR